MIRTTTALLLLLTAAAAAVTAAVTAPGARAADLTVQDAFSRATPGPDTPAVAYLTIHGGDTADRLLSVTSPAAATVGLHSMVMDGPVMRMRAVPGIDIPAHATVQLAPGAPLHLMLEGRKSRLRPGDRIPLLLHFAQAGDRSIEAVVGSPGQATMPR